MSLKIRNSMDSQERKLIIVGYGLIFENNKRKKGVDKT